MNHDHARGSSLDADSATPDASRSIGKRTLTDGVKAPPVQRKAERMPSGAREVDATDVSGGLPANLRGAMESMSGIDLSDVRVHHGSSRPADLQALAYASGDEIHLGPGQEQYLAHEAWHVVQQKQGRVAATAQMKGGPINDDPGLEHEADLMGARALELASAGAMPTGDLILCASSQGPAQLVKDLKEGAVVTAPIDHGKKVFVITKVNRDSYQLEEVEGELVVTVDEWKVVLVPDKVEGVGGKKETKKTEGMHVLTGDQEGMSEQERARVKTPSYVKANFPSARDGKTNGAVTAEHVDFTDSAHLGTTAEVGATSVTITMVVRSNPSYMCTRPDGEVKDLVPLFLATTTSEQADCIAVIEPTTALNKLTTTVTYDFTTLATIASVGRRNGMDPRVLTDNEIAKAWLMEKSPTFAVNAYWLAKNSSGVNSYNHRSGGIDQKGGSGLVQLRLPTLEDLKGTETTRIEDWNRGETLREGRHVYDDYSGILQEDKEMATTLEAESEYIVETRQELAEIVRRMQALAENKEYWKELGMLGMSDKGEKTYTDTYYDVFKEGGEHNHLLLNNEVVMRRRSVIGDEQGTFLFAIKGRSVHMGEETIRLAAQCQLDEEALMTEEGIAAFKEFLGDTETDNAIGRVLDDAMKSTGHSMEELTGDGYDVKPVMTVSSKRNKFFMTLENNTGIDFSADVAEGWIGTGEKPGDERQVATVCSFEFGVGHPGLSATDTGNGQVGGDGGGDKAQPEAPKSFAEKQGVFGKAGLSNLQKIKEQSKPKGNEPEAPTFTRPYHVPKDLENNRLFQKRDYGQFKKLRDEVIDKALARKKGELQKGGNKSSLLAQKLNLIAKKAPPKRPQPQQVEESPKPLFGGLKRTAPKTSQGGGKSLFTSDESSGALVVRIKHEDEGNAPKLERAFAEMGKSKKHSSSSQGEEGRYWELTFTSPMGKINGKMLVATLETL